MKQLATAVALMTLIASPVCGGDRVSLENVKKEWQNAYGVIIYTVLGDVKNLSDGPVRYVKLRVELSDKEGKPVAERIGYNLGAEILADDAVAGSGEEKLARVKPIAPGGQDIFRLSFDKADIGKPFRTATVSIIEIR